MNNQSPTRLILFFLLSFVLLLGSDYLMRKAGWIKPTPRPVAKAPAQPVPEVVAADGDETTAAKAEDRDEKAPAGEEVAKAAPTAAPEVERVDPRRLVLGATADGASPFLLRVAIDQHGGGVQWIESARIEGERTVKGRPREPLQLIHPDLGEAASFSLGLATPKADGTAPDPVAAAIDTRLWEVQLAEDGSPVHTVPADKDHPGPGQEIRLQTTVDSVEIRRTYRLWPGEETVGMTLEFRSPGDDRTFAYRLLGPHDVPIEGEWYTSTFRDAFIGQATGEASAKIDTVTAYNVVQNQDNPYRFTQAPVRFAGVENQYFAVMVLTSSRADSEKWLAEARTTTIEKDEKDKQKSDVTVDLVSKKLSVGPNRSETHAYTIFAGPKTVRSLPAVAHDLASYRKGMWVVGDLASFVAGWVIAPLLDKIYALTAMVGGLFGAGGNWGIAIILLTMTVRLAMFPISRRQAVSAKRMQDLQPHINELREKYKDDKERITKETFALYGKHKVNPFGGCLPALVQLPIFIGLWQALNNSVDLRHASFLWIQDLAAPDMLFKFPFDMTQVPFLGGFLGPYFNVLPLIVAGLMLVHTKLFAPPATTPEAEAQQSMMKYMMVFMVFMFYKVPAGLGIYFITSSLWQLAERLLLPKVLPATKAAPAEEVAGESRANDGGRGGKGGPDGNGDGRDPKGPKGGWLAQKLEKLLEEASKDPTVRSRMQALEDARTRDAGREKGGGGKPRTRPGKRR